MSFIQAGAARLRTKSGCGDPQSWGGGAHSRAPCEVWLAQALARGSRRAAGCEQALPRRRMG